MTPTEDVLRNLFLAALMVVAGIAMTATLPGLTGAEHSSTTDADAHLDSGETYEQGERLWLRDSSGAGMTYQIRKWDATASGRERLGALVAEVPLDTSGSAVIDTRDLEGEYVLVRNQVETGERYPVGVTDGRNESFDGGSGYGWEVTAQNDDDSPDESTEKYPTETPDDSSEETPAHVDVDDRHVDSGKVYWQGQTLVFRDASARDNDVYQIRTYDSDEPDNTWALVTEVPVDSNGYAEFDTTDLDGRYLIEGPDGQVRTFDDGQASLGDSSTASFEVTPQVLAVTLPDEWSTGETAKDPEVEIESNRRQFDVTVSAGGDLDEDELSDVFANFDQRDTADDQSIVITGVRDGTYSIDTSRLDSRQYDFEFEVTDTDASASETMNLSNVHYGRAQFEDGVVTEETGDVAEIPVRFGIDDEATLVVGRADQDYWIAAHLTDGDFDGEVTVKFNTYTAGSNVASDVKLWAADRNDTVEVVTEGGAFTEGNERPRDGLLNATDYDMNVSVGHFDGLGGYPAGGQVSENAFEYGTLSLQDRSTDNLSVRTAPAGEKLADLDADDVEAGIGANVSASHRITYGDYVVFQIDASGVEGVFQNVRDPGDRPAVLNNDATTLDIEPVDSGLNRDAGTIDIADATVQFVSAADSDRYYLVVTAAESAGFENGGEYEATFSAFDRGTDHDSVLNTDSEDESVSGEFAVVGPQPTLDTTDDGSVLVEPVANGTIAAVTDREPGTELSMTIRSRDQSTLVARSTAEVQTDGTVTFTGNFSDLTVGTNLSITFEGEKYDGRVVDAVDASEPGEVSTGQNGTATRENGTSTGEDETSTGADERSTDGSGPDAERDAQVPTDDAGPGFTVVVTLGALITAGLFAVGRSD